MKNLLLFFSILPILAIAQDKIVLENLGKHVNSKYEEVNPMISPDGKTLYFARKDHPENTYGQHESADIWFSRKDKSGIWSPAKKMPAPFNQSRFNSIFGITPDGNTVIIKGAYEKGKYKGVGLSVVNKQKKGWSPPQALVIENYDKMSRGIYDGAFLASDNKTLLIYLSEKKNDPTCDLYVSFRKENNTWSKPLNLGKTVNSPGLEACPFLAPDGVTLYFSSTRPDGFGDADIYKTTRLDDTWTNWSEPENLGANVNTEKRETYYSLPASADYAFMVVNPGESGMSDIVKIRVEKAARPEPVVMITGKILDHQSGKPLEAEVSYQNLSTGTTLGTAKSDPETGEYKIVIPKGSMVGFSAKTEGYWITTDHVDLTSLQEYKEITKDFSLKKKELIECFTLNNIFFESGSAILKKESDPELETLRKLWDQNPGAVIEIHGHTDNSGEHEANMKLSEDRAISVKDYLVKKGISSDKIRTRGFGETKPVADNATEEGKTQNRRVEFMIVSF